MSNTDSRHTDILAMWCTSNIVICDICCFSYRPIYSTWYRPHKVSQTVNCFTGKSIVRLHTFSIAEEHSSSRYARMTSEVTSLWLDINVKMWVLLTTTTHGIILYASFSRPTVSVTRQHSFGVNESPESIRTLRDDYILDLCRFGWCLSDCKR